jgi:membrane dipeptidase
MVDISHVGEMTAADAMAVSRSPIIASHSTVKAVHDNPRGLTDAQLEAIRDGGGVAQITAYRSYIEEIDPRISAAMDILGARLGLNSGPDFRAASPEILEEYAREPARIRETFDDVTLAAFLDHLDHAVAVAGIEHVGLSGEFDGGGGVKGWDNAAQSPDVAAALIERGYSEDDLAKIRGENLLRVMREIQAAVK